MSPTAISSDGLSPPAEVHSRPLVVGYVLKMFPRFSETFILNEILELERRGLRVVIFSMKPPNESVRQPDVERVRAPVYLIPPFRGTALRRHLMCHLACFLRSPRRYLRTLVFARRRGTDAAWTKFLLAPFIARTARAEGVEHFHAHFASGPARQAKLASLLSGIPYSFTAHAKDLFWTGHHHGQNNKLKKRIRLASFVVTISEYNREFIQNLNFKVPRRRLVTIYNGLDLSRWPPRRREARFQSAGPAEPPLILAVGRLVPKKGLDVLLGACRLLRNDGFRFRCLVAGDGPEKPRLQDLIREYDLGESVDLAGPVPQDRLRTDLYMRAAVLVQPSVVSADGDQDGIPTVILEALASGLPVVATPVSGIGEAVIDGRTGLLVPASDPIALAAAIRRLCEDPTLGARLSSGGRRLAEARFNMKQNAKLLVHLMEASARGVTRWSNDKLREKMGLESLERVPQGATRDDAAVEA